MLRGEASYATVCDRSRTRVAQGCEAKPIASYVHCIPSPNTPNQARRLLLAVVEPLRRSAANRLKVRNCRDGFRRALLHSHAAGGWGRSVSALDSPARGQGAIREIGNRSRETGAWWHRAPGLRQAWHGKSRGTPVHRLGALVVLPQEAVTSSRFVVQRTNPRRSQFNLRVATGGQND